MWQKLITGLAGSWLGARLMALWVKREKARLRAHERAALLEELRRWEQDAEQDGKQDGEGDGAEGGGKPPGPPQGKA